MDSDPSGIRSLLTRFKKPIPFGTQKKWEEFGKMYVQCYTLLDILSKPAEYQQKILSSVISGVGTLNIWDIMISLTGDTEQTNFFRATKALVDGHMGVYGFEEVKFKNLETLINDTVQSEGAQKGSIINQNGLHYYKYRVVEAMVEPSAQVFQIQVNLYLDPIAKQFDDLVSLGVMSYPETEPDEVKQTDEVVVNTKSLKKNKLKILPEDDLDEETLKLIREEFAQEGVNIEVDSDEEMSD